MKTKFRVRLAGLCGALAAFAFSENTCRATESPSASPAEKSSPGAEPALTRAEALKIVAGARHYVAHPSAQQAHSAGATQAEPAMTTPDFDMAEPPPAPRAETKPPSPAPSLVWVAGHFMPVKGVWRWVNGEWAAPVTPISVWIQASYDAKVKRWSPGYWQPDATTTPTAESTPKPATPAAPARGL